jgi:heme oxygenase
MQPLLKIYLIVFRYLKCLIMIFVLIQHGVESYWIHDKVKPYENMYQNEYNTREVTNHSNARIIESANINLLRNPSGSYMHQ